MPTAASTRHIEALLQTDAMSELTVTTTGSYAPTQSAYGMAGYVRSDDGSYSVIVTSRGAP